MNITRSSVKFLLASATICLPFIQAVESFAQIRFNAPKLTAPGNRESGAARSDTCVTTVDDDGLTAVLPETNVGLTTNEFPSFFAYVPANNAERAELRLLEEDTGNELYAGQVSLPSADPTADYRHEASLVSLSIPGDGSATALESGKNYLWALMLVCEPDNRAADIVVTGVVQRVDDGYLQSLSPEVRDRLDVLNTLPPEEQLIAYGDAGIWQDLLGVLSTLTSENPTTYQADWNSLLGDQGLGTIAERPIVFSEVEPL